MEWLLSLIHLGKKKVRYCNGSDADCLNDDVKCTGCCEESNRVYTSK